MEKDNRDLEKIISLFETTSVEKANSYISEGWVLLNIHTTDYGHCGTSPEYCLYSWLEW
ncbi:hypothetical protein D3C75_319010 [compost metagenome]